MTTIVPRWEWRTFGDRFGPAEAAFAALAPSAPPHDSDEIYLLSPGGGSVKVRDGKIDIKALREIDEAGLERWEPVLKADFPISGDDASRVGAELRLDRFSPARASYDLDELTSELAKAGSVRAVPVHKRRVRYTVGGCMAELSDVVVDGRATRTLAIESEDAAAVAAAVDQVGLDGYLNTSYPSGLAAVLDGTVLRYAVIDVGTNSIKFHVGERDAAGAWRTVADRAELTQLGEGLATSGVISSEALERTVTAMSGMVGEAKRTGVRAIAPVGTAGLRIAGNRNEVVSTLLERTGVVVEVISGEDEARLAYRGAMDGLTLGADASIVVFDTGGGSTQITSGRGTRVDERFSVNVGAVGVTERFGLDRAVELSVLDDAVAAITAELTRLADLSGPDALVGMGGGVTNLAAVHLGLAPYDPEVVQGSELTRDELDRQIELYRTRDADGRRTVVGLQPKRAEVILAGACIVRTIMDRLGVPRLTVSDRGLRHGVLAERFGP
jgi:exopolyphosphatase / guanosine-5'-triphosphate,3'-diphosphate pyrophosphatase